MSRADRFWILAIATGALAGCASDRVTGEVEALALSNRPLVRPGLSADVLDRREADLALAVQRLAEAPDDLAAHVWYGRRLAYLGRYREAIAAFTTAIEKFPDAPEPLRHRGHRLVTTRRFEDAVSDLRRAASLAARRADEPEEDGLPNARGIPTSTLRGNIHYHLGLAHFLRAEFSPAAAAFEAILALDPSPDQRVAAIAWLRLALERQTRGPMDEKDRDAASRRARAVGSGITADLEVLENHAYRDLVVLWEGGLGPDEVLVTPAADPGAADFVTRAYGVSAWLRCQGREEEADRLLERIVETDNWAAFGYIAAEADAARRAAAEPPVAAVPSMR